MIYHIANLYPLKCIKVDTVVKICFLINYYHYIHDNNLFYTFNKIICKRKYADKG